MLTRENRSEIIRKFSNQSGDTGSTRVQIALITERIKLLSSHLKTHKKDYATQLGLLKLVGQRRRLLSYLKRVDSKAYSGLLKALELRK